MSKLSFWSEILIQVKIVANDVDKKKKI
jgi:hypothetical protein